jgi:hypothetical protein
MPGTTLSYGILNLGYVLSRNQFGLRIDFFLRGRATPRFSKICCSITIDIDFLSFVVPRFVPFSKLDNKK